MPTTSNFGWTTPADTDLVKDGALAIRTLGNGIDTSLVDLKGGTTGQVLSKNTNTDLDFTWITQNDADAIQNSIVDAKGDLISATANDTPARLAVGTNGHVLTADSTTSTGLKWAASPSGMVFLNGTTLSSSTSTSVNNVFSSTYKHYLILLEGAVVTNNASAPYLKLRASGTDSSASYTYQSYYVENTTFAAGRTSGGTLGFWAGESGYVNTVGKTLFTWRLTEPGTANKTACLSSGGSLNMQGFLAGFHDVATAYDGFTIVTNYQFTGTVRTYGLAES